MHCNIHTHTYTHVRGTAKETSITVAQSHLLIQLQPQPISTSRGVQARNDYLAYVCMKHWTCMYHSPNLIVVHSSSIYVRLYIYHTYSRVQYSMLVFWYYTVYEKKNCARVVICGGDETKRILCFPKFVVLVLSMLLWLRDSFNCCVEFGYQIRTQTLAALWHCSLRT